MKSFSNKNVEPALQFEKRLLPIEKYAAKEGVSMPLVEECGRLGIVQIKKYNGKIFVVDDCRGKGFSVSESGCYPAGIEAAEKASCVNQQKTDKKSRVLEDRRLCREDLRSTADGRPRLVKRIGIVIVTACLLISVFANLWLYMDRDARIERLDNASARIDKLVADSSLADSRRQITQGELEKSKTQIGHLQRQVADYESQVNRLKDELAKAGAEVDRIQSELAETKQQLADAEHRNATAAERLNTQIQKLTGKLAELTNK